MTWTDERLDDLSKCVDNGFSRVEQRLESIEKRLDQDIRDLRNWFIGGMGTMIAGFVALFLHMG